MKKKVLKLLIALIVIVLICLVVLGIILTRKYFIIQNIGKQLVEYKKSNNFFVEVSSAEITDSDSCFYKKDELELEKIVYYRERKNR